MRLALDSKRAFHNFRGLGNFSRSLIQNLLRFSDHELLLYTPQWNDSRAKNWFEQVEKTRLEVVTQSGILGSISPSLWRTFSISGDLKERSVDLYHGLSHELPRGQFAAKKVLTVHDILFHLHPESFSWIDRKIYKNKLLNACERSDKIISITERTKLDLIEHFQIPEKKIDVVYQTCDDEFFRPVDANQRDPWLEKLGLKNNDYFFYVGALVPHKNAFGLLKAFLESNVNQKLVILGRGSEKQKLVDYFENYSGGKEVIFLEGMTLEELHYLYSGARAFLWPSLYEGFGIPLIEALSTGTACMTSRGSCFSEAAGEGALYVDPKSNRDMILAIEKLSRDGEFRKSLVEKGQKYIQKFRPDAVTKDLNKVYQSLF